MSPLERVLRLLFPRTVGRIEAAATLKTWDTVVEKAVAITDRWQDSVGDLVLPSGSEIEFAVTNVCMHLAQRVRALYKERRI